MDWQAILKAALAHDKGPSSLENSMYFNLIINENHETAYTESKRFLDEYYTSDWSQWKVNIQSMIVRFSSYDQKQLLSRFITEAASLL